jgi:hypothetical protein
MRKNNIIGVILMLEMLIQYLDELFYGFLIAGEIVEEKGKHKLAKILFKIAKAFAWMFTRPKRCSRS